MIVVKALTSLPSRLSSIELVCSVKRERFVQSSLDDPCGRNKREFMMNKQQKYAEDSRASAKYGISHLHFVKG